MKNKTLLSLVTAILVITLISACTPVDRIISEKKPIAISFVDKQGKFNVVDIKTGKIIPPCSKRPTEDYEACIDPFSKNFEKAKSGSSTGKLLSSNSNVEVIDERKITIIRWIGSECITYYDWATGDWIEDCIPTK